MLTVVTGGVRSNIVRQLDPELPPNSLYRPIHEFWLKRVHVSQEAQPMDTAAYAESVVRQVAARTRRPWFWQGTYAWICWAMNTFLWKGYSVRSPLFLPSSPTLFSSFSLSLPLSPSGVWLNWIDTDCVCLCVCVCGRVCTGPRHRQALWTAQTGRHGARVAAQ